LKKKTSDLDDVKKKGLEVFWRPGNLANFSTKFVKIIRKLGATRKIVKSLQTASRQIIFNP
jgi:hypothetical protein